MDIFWFVIALLTFVAGVGGLLVREFRLGGVGLIALSLLITTISAIDVVKTGNVQVVTRFGKVVRTNGEGLSIHIPYVEQTKSIDTTIRRETANSTVATANLQQVTVDVAVNYRITRDSAIKQYQNFTKKDFVQIVVQPKLQDSIKTVTPRYTAETLITERPQVAEEIKQTISEALTAYGIEVVDVSIANYSFSPEYTQAVANKSVLEQQIKAAQLQAQKNEEEGKANIIAANYQAEQRRIEAQQEDKNLEFFKLQIQSKAVEKWNGVSPQYVGDGTVLTVPLK